MTVNKLASKDIATVFERVGGLNGLVKWIKASNRNRERFYMKYGQEIAAVIASSSSDARVETDPQELTNTIERLLTDIRAARLRGDQAAATVTYIDDDGVSHVTRSTDLSVCVDDDGVSHVKIYVDLSAAVEHRASNMDGVNNGVTPIDHGLRDTPHGIEETVAAQPELEQPKSNTPAQPRPDDIAPSGFVDTPQNIRRKYYTPSGALITEMTDGSYICQPPAKREPSAALLPAPRDVPAPHSNIVGLYVAALGEGSAPDYGINWSQTRTPRGW